MKQFRLLLSALTMIILIAALLLPTAPAVFAGPPAPPTDGSAALKCAPVTPAHGAAGAANGQGKHLWQHVPGTPPPAKANAQPAVNPRHSVSYTLNRGGMHVLLATAPQGARPGPDRSPWCCRCRTRCGEFQDFAVEESPDHGARAGREAPGHQDLPGPRHRRSGGHDPLRPHPARLPRLGPLAARAPGTSTRTTTSTTASMPATSAAT